jgi:DNA-binding transcriptional ArsR family regulator
LPVALLFGVPKTKRHIVRTHKQLAALASASRQEVADVLAAMGTVSVAELTSALGRPADALYFHVRALERAGLIRRAGYRFRQGHKEALFRTVAPELRRSYEPNKPHNRKGVTTIVGSMLRLGMRNLNSAFEPGDAIVSGRHRDSGPYARQGGCRLPRLLALIARSSF